MSIILLGDKDDRNMHYVSNLLNIPVVYPGEVSVHKEKFHTIINFGADSFPKGGGYKDKNMHNPVNIVNKVNDKIALYNKLLYIGIKCLKVIPNGTSEGITESFLKRRNLDGVFRNVKNETTFIKRKDISKWNFTDNECYTVPLTVKRQYRLYCYTGKLLKITSLVRRKESPVHSVKIKKNGYEYKENVVKIPNTIKEQLDNMAYNIWRYFGTLHHYIIDVIRTEKGGVVLLGIKFLKDVPEDILPLYIYRIIKEDY